MKWKISYTMRMKFCFRDDYRISEIEFQENQKYFSEIQQNTIATLMGTLEMTEEEVNEFVKCDRYYDEEETFKKKIIFERKVGI